MEVTAMPNKTIYVSDDDLPLLDQAQELSGANLSSTIAVALRQFVAATQADSHGYREITVRVGGPDGTRRQRFRGRRLARWRHVAAQSRRAEVFSVYQTEKGRFAVHIQRGPEWVGWIDPEDELLAPQMLAALRERAFASMTRSMDRSQRPPVPPMPQVSPWWREGWPTSGGSMPDLDAEAKLEVYESIKLMRDEYPSELCDLVARAMEGPEVEELDI